MKHNDLELLLEALRKQREKVSSSPKAARALLIKLGLLTKSGKIRRSALPRQSDYVSR